MLMRSHTPRSPWTTPLATAASSTGSLHARRMLDITTREAAVLRERSTDIALAVTSVMDPCECLTVWSTDPMPGRYSLAALVDPWRLRQLDPAQLDILSPPGAARQLMVVPASSLAELDHAAARLRMARLGAGLGPESAVLFSLVSDQDGDTPDPLLAAAHLPYSCAWHDADRHVSIVLAWH